MCGNDPVYRLIAMLLVIVVVGPIAIAEEATSQANAQEDANPQKFDSESIAFFESKIRPVLVKQCYRCHSNETGNARGGLRLGTRQLSLIGGDGGPAIVPGNLDESLLWTAINYEDYEMPPSGPLPENVIEDFRVWIESGAADPRETKVSAIASTITPQEIAEAQESFWAYRSPVRQAPPPDEPWAITNIDRFVSARLKSSGRTPNPDAAPFVVLRRLTFDLVGLAPTPKQSERFLMLWERDPDEAMVQAADHLLDQSQFGERWGRHWLDVTRFAESTGGSVNITYPHAWRYRDYVIDSFNQDKPYDEFVQEQIAGDLLPAKNDQEWNEHLIATTFLAMGTKNVMERNPVQFAADTIDEQIDTTTRVFLGQSVACARCHDHKFDPIPQTDYYAMAGIFASTKTYFGTPASSYAEIQTAQIRRSSSLIRLPIEDPNPYDRRYTKPELKKLTDEINERLGELAELGSRRQEDREKSQTAQKRVQTRRERVRLQAEISRLSGKLGVVDEQGQPRSYCMGTQDHERPTDSRVLIRGEIDAPGPIVQRGAPQVLCKAPLDVPRLSSGRRQLAQWIGSDKNPVAARVMVNRVWGHLLGQGIVRSTENFGSSGTAPSHPQLLDTLAVEFIDEGWSVKSLIRKIVTSRVYRMSSDFDQAALEADPENQLLWRFSPRRLDAEAIRDSMLQMSGKLDPNRPRGSRVAEAGYVAVREGAFVEGRKNRQKKRRKMVSQESRKGKRSREEIKRIIRREQNPLQMEDATFRSVYLPVVRDHVPRSLEVFDFANPNLVIGVRESSITANQALYLMNNPFVIDQSQSFAHRIENDFDRPSDQVQAVFVQALGREPSASERRLTIRYLRSSSLAAVCQGLFASAEFRFLN